MPTVPWIGPYRIFFYSSDQTEPPHVHVERDENRARFWLDLVRLQDSGVFRGRRTQSCRGLVAEHREALRKAWYEFFGS